MHSWTPCKGLPTGVKDCCYTGIDIDTLPCMHNKVREITGNSTTFKKGFEISHWSSGRVFSRGAVQGWKNSKGHNEVLIGEGLWEDLKYIGCYYDRKYAHCWFA